MRTLKVMALATVVLTATACGMSDRRWGPCALGGAFLGGALGDGAQRVDVETRIGLVHDCDLRLE